MISIFGDGPDVRKTRNSTIDSKQELGITKF